MSAFDARRKTEQDEVRHLGGTLSLALVFYGACVACLVSLGMPFNRNCTGADALAEEYTGCFDTKEFCLSVFGILSAFAFFGFASSAAESASRQSRTKTGRAPALVALALLLAATLLAAILSWVLLMKPGDTYQVLPDGSTIPDVENDWTVDSWQVFLGGLIFTTTLPFAAAVAYMMHLVLRAPARSRPSHSQGTLASGVNAGTQVAEPLLGGEEKTGQRSSFGAVVVISLVFLVVCFVMTASLSPVWNYSANSYFKSVSEFSWTFTPLGGELPYCLAENSTCSCQSALTDKTGLPGGEHHRFNCWFTFKVFTDTMLYYGFLALAVIVGAVMQTKKWRWAAQRLPPPLASLLPAWVQPFPDGLTVLECGAILATFVLFVLWAIYWFFVYARFWDVDYEMDCGYDYDGGTANGLDACPPAAWSHQTIGSLHVSCRAMGHMSALSFALTMLPTSKDSPLLSAIGVSWEQALHWHRGLGAVAYWTVTLHMVLWWIKWAHDGTFVRNLFRIDDQAWMWITPVWNHFENWSVLMAQISWVFFTVAIVIAWTVRRSMYRLFYAAHHLAVVFLVFGLVHAWAFWYFAIPGCILWWIDRVSRMARSAHPAYPVRLGIVGSGDVVHLELDAPHLARAFKPGQYTFVCVPAVSRREWHPFTINAEGDRIIFLIKVMSENGWTSRLLNVAKAASEVSVSDRSAFVQGSTAVGLYGGVAAAEFRCSPGLFVAGGIGVTPVVSVFEAAVRQGSHTADNTFLWVVREVADLDLPHVRDVLQWVSQLGTGCARAIVHVTRAKPHDLPESSGPGLAYMAGRPDLRSIVVDIVTRTSNGLKLEDGGFAFACGPAKLQSSVLDLGREYGFAHTHVETFLF